MVEFIDAVVPIIVSGITSYILVLRYQRKKEYTELKEKIMNAVVEAWLDYETTVEAFVNKPSKMNELSAIFSKSINKVYGLFKIYTVNDSEFRNIENLIVKIKTARAEASKKVILGEFEFLQHLEFEKEWKVGDTFMELLNSIKALKIGYTGQENRFQWLIDKFRKNKQK